MHATFRYRSFISSSVALSFLVATISGIGLFLRPEGSLARWVNWSLLGADKKQWEALHTAAVALFALLAVVHLWQNRRPLLAHLRRPVAPAAFHARLEPIAAVVLVGVVVVSAMSGWQPLASLTSLRSSIKDGRFAVRTSPPVLDADRLSVKDACTKAALTPETGRANAQARGVVIHDTSKTLATVAKEQGLTPEEVFEALTGESSALR